MYSIELHGDAREGKRIPTFQAKVSGIDTIGRVEAWLNGERLLAPRWRRAYVLFDDNIVAVIARWPMDAPPKNWRYIARASHYNGMELPYVHPAKTAIVTAPLSQLTSSQAIGEWLVRKLSKDVATAIIVDDEGVWSAWEGISGEPQLVASRAEW